MSSLTTQTGAMTLGGNLSSAGALTLFSQGALALNGGPVSSVNAALLTSNAGTVTLQNLNFSTSSPSVGNITLASATGASVLNSFLSSAGGLTLSARNGNVLVDANSNIRFPGSNGGLTATAVNGSLSLQQNTDGFGGGGYYPLFVTGTATAGITVNGDLESAAAANGSGISLLATGGDFNANATIVSGAGNLVLTAQNGAMTLGGRLTSAGALTLSSSGLLTLDSSPIQSVGASSATSTGDALTVNNLTYQTTGAGSALSLNGHSGVSVLNSFLSTAGALSLTSSVGNVSVDANSNLQFPGNGGSLTLTAPGGNVVFTPNTIDYGGTGDAPTGITLTAGGTLSLGAGLVAVPSPADPDRRRCHDFPDGRHDAGFQRTPGDRAGRRVHRERYGHRRPRGQRHVAGGRGGHAQQHPHQRGRRLQQRHRRGRQRRHGHGRQHRNRRVQDDGGAVWFHGVRGERRQQQRPARDRRHHQPRFRRRQPACRQPGPGHPGG